MDSAGKIYVADSGNNRIVRMNDMTGTGRISPGTPGNRVNQFNTPAAVATDASGNIYIADSITGNWSTLQLNLLYFPFITSGVAVDSQGDACSRSKLPGYRDLGLFRASGARHAYGSG